MPTKPVRDSSPVPARLWERPHVLFLAIAYGFSWVVWIGAWVLASAAGAGDLAFNADLVWDGLFGGAGATAAIGISLLSSVGVYGPLIGGIIATRADPAVPRGDLARRVRRIAVGGRTYGLIAAILLVVTVPAMMITAATGDPVEDPPAATTLLAFLLAFFVVQVLTSGTEEVGWRGYLTEKLLPGRGFWDTGWVVGLVWAVWHYPVVVQMFVQQGMVHVQVIGSLAGFTIGIVAMAILQAWFYERTESVFVSIVIHAAFNTVPLTVVLLFQDSPAAILGNLMLWVVVIALKARVDRSSTVRAGHDGPTTPPAGFEPAE